jgi:hypothetical protein
MADRVRALKRESAATGGDDADELEYPTILEPNEDHLDARGLYLQNDSSADTAVNISRDASNRMVFKDAENPSGTATLSDLLAGGGGSDFNDIVLSVAGTVVYVGDGDIVLRD